MNKHTPGPWRYGRTPGTEKMPEWFIAAMPADVASVMLMHDTRRPMGEHEANARLIASCPELLEALETIARGSVSDAGPNGLGVVSFDYATAKEIARAAIRKARGE